MAEVVFMDLRRFMDSLRGDLFKRWMRRAQKSALIEWRDRREFPGLMARFEIAAYENMYRFAIRASKSKTQPPFVHSGNLRTMLKARQPKARTAGTDVVTILRFGGGALNFLGQARGRSATTQAITRITSIVRGYLRQQGGPYGRTSGTAVNVSSYAISRPVKRTVSQPATRTYRQEFAEFTQDAPWIARRVQEHFLRIARRAALDRRGAVKSTVLEELDDG